MKPLARLLLSLAAPLLAVACSTTDGVAPTADGVEAIALTGGELVAPEFTPERRAQLEENLSAALREVQKQPEDEMAAVWHGRRLAYLGRYREAIDVYTDALDAHPKSYKLLRHRGHRYLTVRELELASADLRIASRLTRKVPDQIEPDGAPNAAGIPRSTTRSNIEYHLGLALYLQERYDEAYAAYERCLFFSQVNDDMLVATTYWTVLTLWRLDRQAEADRLLERIHGGMDVIENDTYWQLLLLYKGDRSELELLTDLRAGNSADASLGYGLAAWNFAKGRTREGLALCQEVVAESPWAYFGHLAAEAELARRQ